jgi:hypothetical protein
MIVSCLQQKSTRTVICPNILNLELNQTLSTSVLGYVGFYVKDYGLNRIFGGLEHERTTIHTEYSTLCFLFLFLIL